ncbi:MAG: hypothetical protein WC974_08515 [Thermoplasmata archaeon]
MKDKNTLRKQESFAFGKKIFLLGKDSQGQNYWLEEPKWDCEWYWGFGYVETYTNNKNPRIAKDISSHQHISGFLGQQEKYDSVKGCFVEDDFIHNLYDNKTLTETTFTEKEGWQLSELFEQFYLLQKMAAFTHKELPGCHITTSPVNHGNLSELHNKPNKEMILLITAKILDILSVDYDKIAKDSQV